MKKSVYLDTTFPSYLFDDRESIHYFCKTTQLWWKTESSLFDVFISLETIAELDQGDYPKKQEILEFASQIDQLEPVPEIPQIVAFYLEHNLMPKIAKGDAVHLAYASYYKIDFLLTWNCNHLANANKRQHIRVINGRLGLSVPEIITPLELFREELNQ